MHVGSRLLSKCEKHSLLQEVYDCEKIGTIRSQRLAVRANRRSLDDKLQRKQATHDASFSAWAKHLGLLRLCARSGFREWGQSVVIWYIHVIMHPRAHCAYQSFISSPLTSDRRPPRYRGQPAALLAQAALSHRQASHTDEVRSVALVEHYRR